ncbi:hypothetical protein GGI42DRAFT_166328 [Trichoderma sp. SZMC 28013]
MVTLAKVFQSLGGLVLLFFFVFFFGTAWRRRKVSILLLSCYIRTCHEIRDFFGGYPRKSINASYGTSLYYVYGTWKGSGKHCRAVHQYGVL